MNKRRCGIHSDFKYDRLNRIIEIQEFYQEEPIKMESFRYNDNRHLMEKLMMQAKFTYKYNSNGQLIE